MRVEPLRRLLARPEEPAGGIVTLHISPRAPVERHAEDQLARRHACGQELADGTVRRGLIRIGRVGVEVRVVTGQGIAVGLPEVVRHEVHEVDRGLHLLHLGVGQELGRGARGEGQQVMAVPCRALLVERGAQLGHERGEILLVLGTMGVSVAGQRRVLPVHVEAV